MKWLEGIRNKNILVTGASSDLGVAFLRELMDVTNGGDTLKIGAHFYSNPAPLESIKNNNFILLNGNLNSADSCYALVDSFAQSVGDIDYFLNFVGGIKNPIHWKDLMWTDWQEDLNVNLSSSFFLAQRVVRYMKKGNSKIIFISTASVHHGGGVKTLAYGIAKAGIQCMTRGLARDLAKDGILVNCIAPGFILTKAQEKFGKNQEDIKKREESIPIGRAGIPEDIARTALYLLSGAGDFVTGQILAIDGGDFL